MASIKTTTTGGDAMRRTEQGAESPREIAQDGIQYLTEYARENPGYAALWCLGIGFVLGWRLKPW
jgi:hypothetical protein